MPLCGKGRVCERLGWPSERRLVSGAAVERLLGDSKRIERACACTSRISALSPEASVVTDSRVQHAHGPVGENFSPVLRSGRVVEIVWNYRLQNDGPKFLGTTSGLTPGDRIRVYKKRATK